MELLKLLVVCFVSYILGSVTFATIVSKAVAGKDIRTLGNHNAGMSNMIASIGAKAGVLTLIGDLLKGMLSVLIAFLVFGFENTQAGVFAALFAMLGHLYPIFFGFRGGKGTAVMGGAILMLRPVLFLVIISVFLLILLTTKYIALSTIACAVIYPLWMYFDCESVCKTSVLLLCICVSILSLSKHIENIYNIKSGKEIRFSVNLFKRKVEEKS